jgi:formylglycine-generating enzyme required for sulfatase activity
MSQERRRRRQEQLEAKKFSTSVLLIVIALLLGVLVFAAKSGLQKPTTQANDKSASSMVPSTVGNFLPTSQNESPVPKDPPEGMVWIPGGEFSMGAQDPPDMDDVGMKATLDSRPIHRVYVDSFWMDQTDVTNTEFAKFVDATGYKTVAQTECGITALRLSSSHLSRNGIQDDLYLC